MHIAILTFEGFNELDSLIAFSILNRVKKPGWRVSIASPPAKVRSMNGVVLEAQASLKDACDADAVLVGSGIKTRDVVADRRVDVAAEARPDAAAAGRAMLGHADPRQAGPAGRRSSLHGPDHQAVGRGGRRGRAQPAVRGQWKRRDLRRVPVVALSGGLFIARLEGVEAARSAIDYVAPVGEKETYVARAMANISPFLAASDGDA